MSKKVGKPKAASPKVSPQAAGKAVVAVSGKITNISKAAETKTSQKSAATIVGNPQAGSSEAGSSSAASASASESASQAGYGYLFRCKDGGRTCNSEMVLEIVPTACGDVITCFPKPKLKLHGQFQLVGEDWGAAFEDQGHQALDALTGRSFATNIKVPAWFLLNPNPDKMEIVFALARVIGTGSVAKSFSIQASQPTGENGLIRIYPGDSLTVSLKTDELWKDYVQPFLKPFETHLKQFLGESFNIGRKGFNASASYFYIKVTTPEVAISAKGQWKERDKGKEDDWMVDFFATLSIGFSPLLEVDIRWDLGLVLADAASTTLIGGAFLAIYQEIKDRLNNQEPPFYISLKGGVKGTLDWELSPTTPATEDAKATGTLDFGIGIQVGNDDGILCATATGKVSGELSLQLKHAEEWKISMETNVGALKGTIKVTLKTGEILFWKPPDIKVEEEVTFFKGWDLPPLEWVLSKKT